MKLIRIDQVGHWRGSEHRSSVMGMGYFEDVEDVQWEDGISCYRVENGEGVEELRAYWVENNGNTDAQSYEGFQVTIFEGEIVGTGADFEELADCKETLAEVDAVEFMGEVLDLHEKFEDDEISEDEYFEELNNLINKAIGDK